MLEFWRKHGPKLVYAGSSTKFADGDMGAKLDVTKSHALGWRAHRRVSDYIEDVSGTSSLPG